jgi:hypothetical protein
LKDLRIENGSSQGQNLALTGLHVPFSLGSGSDPPRHFEIGLHGPVPRRHPETAPGHAQSHHQATPKVIIRPRLKSSRTWLYRDWQFF